MIVNVQGTSSEITLKVPRVKKVWVKVFDNGGSGITEEGEIPPAVVENAVAGEVDTLERQFVLEGLETIVFVST
jgi:hypothetical protein